MVSFSIIIITHGREDLLLKCLESLNPPVGNWQLILVANGFPLSDSIISKAKGLTSEFDLVELSTAQSEGRAKNLARELVKYDWIFFLGEDVYLLPKYFDTLMPLLSQDKIDILGGPDIPAKKMSYLADAFAMALSSPFCTGKTFARHRSVGKLIIPADEKKLNACNLWMRSSLFNELRFPEDYLQNEEISVLLDLEGHGANMFYHPLLMVGHFRTSKITSICSSTFLSGFYRSQLFKEKSTSGEFHFWLPSIFVLGHLLVIFSPYWFLFFGRLYFCLILMMGLSLASRRRNILLFPMITFFHYLIVFSYGLGFLSYRLGYRGKNFAK